MILVVFVTYMIMAEKVYAGTYAVVGISEIQEVEENKEIEVLEKNEEMTMNGYVIPVTTLDITLPINGLYFNIDEDRNFSAPTSLIKNNSNCPIDVYVIDVSKTSSEPDIIPQNTYTEKEWNNLSRNETLLNMGIKLNGKELYSVFNNTNKDKEKALKIGSIKSGFEHTEELELRLDAQFGKSFGTELKNFQYNLVLEFRVP